ncbi:transporter [Amycolatopsis alkalitolerans]|uniref:Transporter n=1 Tax=Amycolatopsis alkalitolerans TaxID=2547244 RepID=A0A5C4LZ78_9PSEU|nr:transporter [Amycolatopsis alkalitolerans]TNC24108.1 transporter [Amycolatopsis alkalitolerans]
MAVLILVVMAACVALILSRKLPTAFALVLLAVVIGLIAGAPLVSGKNSIGEGILQTGSASLASTIIAIILGSWLGALMDHTGIASTVVRKTVELGGDRPYGVAVGVFLAATLTGTVTGSAPAAMLIGLIAIPALIGIGLPPVTAAGVVVVGLSAGIPFELFSWQFLSQAVGVPVSAVRDFQLTLFPIVLVLGLAYVLIEARRRGTLHAWAMRTETPGRSARARPDAPWYSLLTPLVPILLALVLDVPIVPALLIGILYALLTTTRPGKLGPTALRTAFRGFEVAAAPAMLFVAIGILLQAVKLPGVVHALGPLVTAITPHNPVLFVVVLGVLAPLCLYRGPFNIYGMGAGVAGVLLAGHVYPAQAVLGIMASYNQLLGVSDPTSTQTVWSAEFAGVRPEKLMTRTLPYTWLIAIGGLTLTAARFLA